jgi:zinc protease
VKKYFGEIPRQPAPKPMDLTEPGKDGERRARIDDKLARVARLDVSYRVPAITEDDTRALTVGAMILGGGESSRLYQALVKDREIVSSVFAGIDGRAGPSKFQVTAMIRPGKTPAEVDGMISEEIARLVSQPVTDKELQRARTQIRRSAVSGRESMLNIAVSLADNAALYNDPNRVNTESEKRLAVTAADIQKAAKAYLRAANRVVVTTVPAAAPAQPPAKKN